MDDSREYRRNERKADRFWAGVILVVGLTIFLVFNWIWRG